MSEGILGLDHAGVTCADLEASLRFYRDLLGIPMRARGENEVMAAGHAGAKYAWADLELPDGRVVELLEPFERGHEPLPPGTERPGSAHTGLRVADIEAMLARLAEAGVEPLNPPVTLQEPGAWHGSTIAYVRDPDGHAVELVQHP
ncbi:MAG TPA: VOC family protein [Solirubrobacterales bacterium]|nr:VOC family protein [Solirubrobacterales bacterium]